MQAAARVVGTLVLVALATACGKRAGRAPRDGGAAGGTADAGAQTSSDDVPLPRTRILSTKVVELTPPELRAILIDTAPIEAAVTRALAASEAFAPQGGVEHTLEIRLLAETSAERAGKAGQRAKGRGPSRATPLADARKGRQGLVQVLIEVELAPRGDPELSARVARGGVEREFDFAQVDAVKERLGVDLERAVVETLAGLINEERLRSGDQAEIEAALTGNDAEARMLAIRYAGVRKNRGLVERLLGFLSDPDPDVRDTAIGALIEIGDRRAVPALTKLVEFKDTDGMRRILDAVSALGGDEARSYLELVASGHDDPRIQYLAKDALDRLNRREGKAPSP